MWRDLIIADVDECLDSGEAAPGCGLDIVYDNDDIEERSVQRSMSTSSRQSLESIEPEIDYNNPNLVGTWISGVTVDTLFEGTVDGERSIYEVTIGPELRLDDPIVDMTDESPEVTWEGYGASWDPDSGEEAPDDEPDEESEFLPTGMLQ
ncbi:hypothetical protein [Nesterenkonia sp. NBAIMH1]|uniref:hypothetical protein n=1 Tax=Nesterenkonia sp. NBAIMH1 TaxID=2600320 RepID=UPI0011B6B86A|nr:hypothetical protein [Nesterenkonia sp. NBAIMH1]